MKPLPRPHVSTPAIGETNRHPAIVILDFGSQYSELIARRVRETEVYSLVMACSTTAEELKAINPKGIILSGGPSSVYAEHAPQCDPELWNLGIPVLGVCYGMQLMVQQLGGSVVAAGRAEYGKAPLYVDDPTDLLTNVDEGSTMWMSHGDSVIDLPPGFSGLAHTENTPAAAVAEAFWLQRRRDQPYDWLSMACSLGDLAGRRLLAFIPYTLVAPWLGWVWEHRLFTLSPDDGCTILLLFAGLEFSYYWFHRASHTVRWFWASHSVHHSPNQLNLAAAYQIGRAHV